jgi:dihydroorotase
MNILIKQGRVINPAKEFDQVTDLAIAEGRIVSVGAAPDGFVPDKTIDASGLVVAPGLVDLAARLREPGHEHERMLETELAAAVAGGVTSLVCMPDTEPVLDEPGLVEMLKYRAEKLHQARVFPLGALTRGLKGESLTEMLALTESGCVGFSQAEVALKDTQVLQRALQYAASFGLTVWLRPRDAWLGKGVAASVASAGRCTQGRVPSFMRTRTFQWSVDHAIVPVSGTLDLKALAAAAGCRKCGMANAEAAQRATGYLVGGISPLAQKKKHRTFLDASAQALPTVHVSAGRRGLEVALAPADLLRLTSGCYAAIGKAR